MVPGVSVAAEVDEPHVPAAVRQQEAEAGPAAAQHEVGGGRLVAVQVEDGRGGLGAGPGRYPVTVCITFPDTDRCAGVQGCRGAGAGVQGPVYAEDVAILRGHVVRLGLVARAPDEVDSAAIRRSAWRGPGAAT